MKPTKNQLLKISYQRMMDVSILNMKAPIRWINQYVSESVTGFGTAADEKVKSRKDYHKLILDARNQSKGMLYKAVIKTAYRPKMQLDNQAVFNDEISVSIGSKKNLHDITLWMSTAFKWDGSKWQLILFHGSVPNMNTSSADTFHIEEAKKKLVELEQKVAEKTAEIQARNRELEIETSLEKVRTVAMSMKKAEDMLRICKTISGQLQKLGVQEIRNVQTAIFNKRGTYTNYEYYAKHNKEIVTEVAYMGKGVHAEQKKFSQAMLGLGKEIYTQQFKGAGLKKWYSYQKGTNQLADHFLLKAHSLNYYFFSLGEVALGISTYYPLNENELALFKKFRNVFALAYKRYIDIEKATAQAREAMIEAALERVRSKAMSMHNSIDILTTATTAFEELSKIGIQSIRCGVGLFTKTSSFAKVYAATKLSNGAIQTIQAERNTIEHASLRRQLIAWKEQKDLEEILKGEELATYYNTYFFKKSHVSQSAGTLNKVEYGYYFAFSDGLFYSWTDTPYTQQEKQVLDRFRSIIALTFRRFLDLQKAEAQAKEAQIEAALERVRSKAMAMYKSADLSDAASILFDEIKKLGISTSRAGIGIISDKERAVTFYSNAPTKEGHSLKLIGSLTMTGQAEFENQYAHWKKQQNYFTTLSGKSLKSYYNFLSKGINVTTDWIATSAVHYGHWLMFTDGFLFSWNDRKYTDEEIAILDRFKSVVEITFRRYFDLQKAEASAREAQIELALERVRARTMAMHNSKDVGESVAAMFDELTTLGVLTSADRCGIGIMQPNEMMELWTAAKTKGQTDLTIGYLDMRNHKLLKNVYQNWLDKKEIYQYILKGADKQKYYETMRNQENYKIKKDYYSSQEKIVHTDFFFKEGCLYVFSQKQFTDEGISIFLRFTNVFGQTYRRYLDLQKAESQAREAQIEASLEKVRSVAMSMHHSNELLSICESIYAELLKLGITELRNTMINIHNDGDETFLNYDYSAYAGRAVTKYGYHIHPIINHLVMQCRSAQDAFVDVAFEGEAFEAWRSFRKSSGEKDDKRLNNITHLHYYFYSIGIGSIGVSTFESIDEHKLGLLKRFRNVFQLAYQRFTDLAAAEAQAREAQIETALERVRSRTMAMQKSTELADTVQIMFEEFRSLQTVEVNATMARGFITTIQPEKKQFDLWITEIDGTKVGARFKIEFNEPTTGAVIYKAWKRKKPSVIFDLKGAQVDQWLDYLEKDGFHIAENIRGTRRVNTFIYYSQGFIGITSSLPLAEENVIMLQRFAKVFDQTYTRFLDLQTAEAAAKEAIKQAALDRIRADIASMRTKEDLNRITPLIWNELTILGIPFIRCGVFMMDEQAEQIHTFLSTPTGEAIAAFHLGFEEFENIKNIVHHWRTKQAYINHWHRNEFAELAESLIAQGAIPSKEQYLQTLPEDGIHLNFIPFLQGMLYVGNTTPLPADDIHLLQSVADAFSTAYARYEDFNKLEAAKQVVEKTLEELKATQKQLVQSEKMASLGELTAGIAHEIQNPLNFVNNFSELNVELLEELRVKNEELGVKDEDVSELLKDIKTNSEKINHHGKRADGIVKGMLQHSRSSTGQKEATDINALCDEYLRLAYHGLRAKDKTFNAEFTTEFDETIGKINVQPQEMGRVILNLINNAFFAVAKQSEIWSAQADDSGSLASGQQPTPYTPTVTVTTKKLENTIEIKVTDNGIGIPANVKEKIFQPFFTTKPTGQGTGLGLSLAYDIVTKVHGGKLEVESEIGKGSSFIIEILMG